MMAYSSQEMLFNIVLLIVTPVTYATVTVLWSVLISNYSKKLFINLLQVKETHQEYE